MKLFFLMIIVLSSVSISYCSQQSKELKRLEEIAWQIVKDKGVVDPALEEQDRVRINVSHVYDLLPHYILRSGGLPKLSLNSRSVDGPILTCRYICQSEQYSVQISSLDQAVFQGNGLSSLSEFKTIFYVALTKEFLKNKEMKR